MDVTQSPSHALAIRAGLVALLAACVLIAIAAWHVDAMSDAAARAVALVLFVLIGPVEVLVHEGGHFAAARLLGWRVPVISWGPLTLRCSPLKLVFGAPAFGSHAAGAVVAVSPEGGDANWAWAWVSAGGPLANFLLAGGAVVAAYAAVPWSTARALFFLTAVISAVAGLYNLVPRGGSDGAHIVSVLIFHTGPLRGLYARLVEQTLNGIRPRDWRPAFIAAVQRQALWSDDPDLQLAVYAWHIDRGDVAAARNALARAAAEERIAAEGAFLAARYDRDAATAAALLRQTRSWSVHGQTCYWRAESALAQLLGEGDRARAAIRKGRILVREWPYATAFDAECFDAIEKDLEA
jgi:hypothetical protein